MIICTERVMGAPHQMSSHHHYHSSVGLHRLMLSHNQFGSVLEVLTKVSLSSLI